MAVTYKANDAFEFAQKMVSKMKLEEVKLRILDQVSKMMWMAAPWRWSVGVLGQITLASDTVAYTLNPGTDFLYALHAYKWNGTGEPSDMRVVAALPDAPLIVGDPIQIAYKGTNIWNVYPKPGTLSGTWVVQPFYKKIAPVLTLANVHTAGTLLFDDEWSWVYESGVLWAAYAFAADQRAGTVQADSTGKAQFTGQRALFEAGLAQMKEREKMMEFGFQTVPDSKLVNR
jgi:hypothetical protein